MIRLRLIRLRRFASLPRSDRRRLVSTFFLMTLVRVALWVLPFRLLRGLAARLVKPARATPESHPEQATRQAATAARVAWAVDEASRFAPGATCLVRALSAQVLLAREQVPSTLRLGVGRSDGNEFRAHAWLECGGKVVIGGDEDLTRFAPLPQFSWRQREQSQRLQRRCCAMEG